MKLFAGIDLDLSTRAACAQIAARLEGSGLRGRFEAPEKLHVTLAFLGWVYPEQIESIRRALFVAARAAQPFTIALDVIGAFPHERKPRVVWIGARDQGAAFQELARNVRNAYGDLGFSFGEDAVAHVTVARMKKDAPLPMLDVEPLRMRVSELTLFESLAVGRMTRYEVRARAKLGSSGA